MKKSETNYKKTGRQGKKIFNIFEYLTNYILSTKVVLVFFCRMELLSYWTIPYVSINDSRLICLYNVAFLCVIGSLVGNIFWYMTYLQSDTLHGITQVCQLEEIGGILKKL